MKFTLLFIFVTTVQVFGTVYSQNTKLSVNLQNVSITDVLGRIEDQSEFKFLYNDDLIDKKTNLRVNFTDKTVNEILDQILVDTGSTYSILDNNLIVITPTISAGQQATKVSGKITSEKGEPLIGVTVVVKGTTNGTITDIEGNYSLSNIPRDATLVFSFIGMKSQEIAVGANKTINVVLEDETVGIEEVVAVGYGTIRRSEITGAISTVSGKSLAKIPVTNLSSALAGTAKGVMVFHVDGDVGEDAIIKIRGESTIGNSNPLIVIDGVPGGSLRDVPPDEVESVEILKDASAAAIYGSRGANGVILITTKRGFDGNIRITYDGYMKFNTVAKPLKMLDAYSTAFLFHEAQIMDGAAISPYQTPDYEWLKDIDSDYADLLRDSYTYRHKLSIAGGNKQHQFRISGTYDDDDGTFVNNFYKAGTFMFSSDHQFSARLKWSNTFTYKQDVTRKGYAYDTYKAVLVFAPYMAPLIEGDPAKYKEPEQSWSDLAYSRDDDRNRDNYVFNIQPSYTIMDGLVLSDRFAYKQENQTKEVFNYAQKYLTSTGQTANTAAITYTKGSTLLNDIILNFDRVFASKHSVLGTMVFSTEKSKASWLYGFRSGLPFQSVPSINLGSLESQLNDGGYSDDTRVGIVGRLGYTYNKKYVLQASVRRDASSRFTPEKRWATFPSVSFAWNIDQEPFMKNITFVTGAKLRASWGQLGRDKLDAYQFYSMVNLNSGYAFNNSVATGANVGSLPYAGTGWEANETKDVGIEFYCLNNRLYFSADYWKKNTVDMIFDQALPSYAGLRDNTISINGGEIMNKGLEFELTWKEKKGDLNYSVGMNLSTYKNEVVSWPFDKGVTRIMGLGDPRCFAIEKGHPYYAFYMVDAIGIWQNDAEIDAARYQQKNADGTFKYSGGNPVWGWPNYSMARPTPGSLKFKDQNNDGIINNNDYVYKGQRYPKVIIGLNANLEYKNFDFYMICQGNFGQSAYIYAGQGANSRLSGGAPDQVWAYDRWTGEGSTNDVMSPRLSAGSSNQWYTGQANPSDAHLHKADYFRIKSMNLGYTIQPSTIKTIGLSSVRLYVSGSNLFTFTKYPGNDPELGGGYSYDDWSNPGVDRILTYPVPRSYVFGTQITF